MKNNLDIPVKDFIVIDNSHKYFTCHDSCLNKKDYYNNKTDILCWWCKHSFDNTPIPAPISIYKDAFKIYGNFCNFSCAKAYMLSNSSIYKTNEGTSLLNYMYKKMYGKNTDIKPSPHWLSLKCFGGFMEIEEFRENNVKVEFVKMPLLPWNSKFQVISNTEPVKVVKNEKKGLFSKGIKIKKKD